MTRFPRSFLLPALFILAFPFSLHSQGTDIRGTVSDSSNGERIPFATIILQGTAKGAASNTNGFYLIPRIEPGDYVVVASCVGYVKEQRNVRLRGGEAVVVNFRLKPEPVRVSETVVTGKARREISEIQTSVHVMEQKEIRAVPVSAMPDIFRAIQTLPGIVSASDASSNFYVRGGGGDQNLILIDGMKIYNPFHAFGIFSVFDPDIIRTTEVYTGAFPAGFGGSLSSVINLTSKDGNLNRITGKGNVNFLSTKLQVEGPAIDELRWLVSARKSFSSPTFNQFFQKDFPVSFYDGFFKVSTRGSEEREARYGFEGFFSGDNLRSNNPTEPEYSWRNHALGFTANGLIHERVYVELIAYESSFMASRDPKASTTATPASTSIDEAGLRTNATVFLDSKDLFFFGFELTFPTMEYYLVNSYGVVRNDRMSPLEGWAWGRYQAQIGSWLIDGGVQLDLATLMIKGGLDNFQPRISVSRPVWETWRLKMSYGHFSQNMITINNEDDVISIFDTWIQIPDELKSEQADHYVLGIDGNVVPELSLSLQTYYKRYGSLVTYNKDKVDARDPDYVNATGNSYGAEILARYGIPFVDFYGAYSLSRAQITSEGLTYAPRYDRLHNINLLGVFHPLENVDVSLRWEFGSGFPYSQTTGYYDRLRLPNFYLTPFAFETGTPYISIGAKNAARLPSYHRLDFSATYQFHVLSLTGRAGLNIINVYDHKNFFYFDRKTGQQINMLPFFPTATLELEY